MLTVCARGHIIPPLKYLKSKQTFCIFHSWLLHELMFSMKFSFWFSINTCIADVVGEEGGVTH